MASKMSTGLFFTVLFLCYTLTYSSRREPEATVVLPHHHHEDDVEVEEDKCEGLSVGAEECLMRRTLTAHLDYIYTQNHHNRP
ncbi:hypothetical protein AAHE18_05G051900 [Arachis hypogaea]|uniref:Phytosulfokine n=1 Tax=Arachis hypogaea TaxID=3818 RepID=A0A444WU12_ARAHY|nr:phytosulfokines 3 [Arachis hypogaea]RYQ80943.1 hypothetical protein Ahy_Scaffold1g107007 [Arachis hypogaea]